MRVRWVSKLLDMWEIKMVTLALEILHWFISITGDYYCLYPNYSYTKLLSMKFFAIQPNNGTGSVKKSLGSRSTVWMVV